jgi:putative flippase GtrA
MSSEKSSFFERYAILPASLLLFDNALVLLIVSPTISLVEIILAALLIISAAFLLINYLIHLRRQKKEM